MKRTVNCGSVMRGYLTAALLSSLASIGCGGTELESEAESAATTTTTRATSYSGTLGCEANAIDTSLATSCSSSPIIGCNDDVDGDRDVDSRDDSSTSFTMQWYGFASTPMVSTRTLEIYWAYSSVFSVGGGPVGTVDACLEYSVDDGATWTDIDCPHMEGVSGFTRSSFGPEWTTVSLRPLVNTSRLRVRASFTVELDSCAGGSYDYLDQAGGSLRVGDIKLTSTRSVVLSGPVIL